MRGEELGENSAVGSRDSACVATEIDSVIFSLFRAVQAARRLAAPPDDVKQVRRELDMAGELKSACGADPGRGEGVATHARDYTHMDTCLST